MPTKKRKTNTIKTNSLFLLNKYGGHFSKEIGEKMDNDLVNSIGDLAKASNELAIRAVSEYSIVVYNIIGTKSIDSNQIEHTLDGMLDFCFDDKMLLLYKKLCRYYYDIDPIATVSYVNAYREMWDEDYKEKD
jgi:hypothetical protein